MPSVSSAIRIRKLVQQFFALPRPQKRALQVSTDVCLILSSFNLALIMNGNSGTFVSDERLLVVLTAVIAVSIITFTKLGFYRAIIRYLSHKAIGTTILGMGISTATLVFTTTAIGLHLPWQTYVDYCMLGLFTIGGIRVALRGIYQRSQLRRKKRVAIYGAGEAGRQLMVALQFGNEYAPLAFIDQNPDVHGYRIDGLPIYRPDQIDHLINDFGIENVLLALPDSNRLKRQRVLKQLEAYPLNVQTIPAVSELLSGEARISDIREVAIEDLLGRTPVPPRMELMDANIRGKVVMITGAGGSIGSEICNQVLSHGPSTVLLVDNSEYALYQITETLTERVSRDGLKVKLVSLLGSVQNRTRMRSILSTFEVDTIYHTAAYKHVNLVEQNVVEGVQNDIFGTEIIARCAVEAGVSSFIFISTDKAVRPTNVMGACKRMAELVCQAFAENQSTTRFSIVRFGNVLGSSGSVIPLFRKQIREGGPITVTHPDVSRYFMTIPEAAQLVIQAGAMAKGGDVFLLDMGKPVRILDLALRMARLSGLTPIVQTDDVQMINKQEDGDILIKFSELRPGEKLFEELLVDDAAQPTDHPKIMVASEPLLAWPQLENLLRRMIEACDRNDTDMIRELLQLAPTAYHPNAPVVDNVSAGRPSEAKLGGSAALLRKSMRTIH